jgi:hypothetical protein
VLTQLMLLKNWRITYFLKNFDHFLYQTTVYLYGILSVLASKIVLFII